MQLSKIKFDRSPSSVEVIRSDLEVARILVARICGPNSFSKKSKCLHQLRHQNSKANIKTAKTECVGYYVTNNDTTFHTLPFYWFVKVSKHQTYESFTESKHDTMFFPLRCICRQTRNTLCHVSF